MSVSVKTFHLVESEPHPLVARALNTDLWTRCRIENPVPVHFIPIPRWGGLCPDIRDTQDGEIKISDYHLSNVKKEDLMEGRIMLTYLHEFSHGLPPSHDHEEAFFAVNALLLLRAGSDNYDRPLLHDMELYDLHEWDDTPNCQIGETLDWALTIAGELADTELSAEAAAREVLERYTKWKEWKTRKPEREAKAKSVMEAERAAREADKSLIRELRADRWRWAFAALFMGFTLAAALFINK